MLGRNIKILQFGIVLVVGNLMITLVEKILQSKAL